jgi:hypothetical protein
MQSAIKQFPEFDLKASYPPYEIYELKTKKRMWGAHLNRLSENAKFKKSGVAIKGLLTLEFARIPILGQPVKY